MLTWRVFTELVTYIIGTHYSGIYVRNHKFSALRNIAYVCRDICTYIHIVTSDIHYIWHRKFPYRTALTHTNN